MASSEVMHASCEPATPVAGYIPSPGNWRCRLAIPSRRLDQRPRHGGSEALADGGMQQRQQDFVMPGQLDTRAVCRGACDDVHRAAIARLFIHVDRHQSVETVAEVA